LAQPRHGHRWIDIQRRREAVSKDRCLLPASAHAL
jgi:hypothetical protein